MKRPVTPQERLVLDMLAAACGCASQRHPSPLLAATLNVLNELASGRVERAIECLQALARDA